MTFQSKMLAVMPANAKSGGTNNIVAIQKAVIDGTNTQVIEHANLTDLLVEGGRCYGAVGVDDDGEPFVIQAGAVILATGGVGQLFKYSFNPPGNTGDGYAMALRAGAELLQHGVHAAGAGDDLAVPGDGHAVRDARALPDVQPLREIVHQRYLPDGVSLQDVSKSKALHWPVSCRDAAIHLDRAIHGEALAGQGDRQRRDLRSISRARAAASCPRCSSSTWRAFRSISRAICCRSRTTTTRATAAIRVDVDCHSKIRGLFAAGETMGYQGADRLGGTMLGGSQVFGWRAGRRAAEVAKDRPDRRPSDERARSSDRGARSAPARRQG